MYSSSYQSEEMINAMEQDTDKLMTNTLAKKSFESIKGQHL